MSADMKRALMWADCTDAQATTCCDRACVACADNAAAAFREMADENRRLWEAVREVIRVACKVHNAIDRLPRKIVDDTSGDFILLVRELGRAIESIPVPADIAKGK